MNKKIKLSGVSILILLLLVVASIGSVFDYAVRNELMVRESTYKALDNAAQQQLAMLKMKLDDQFAQLEIMANYVGVNGTTLNEKLIDAMNITVEKYHYMGIGLADAYTGEATLNTGTSLDASEKDYFKFALDGERAIEYVERGSLTGVSIVVFSVPVYHDGEIAAVLFAVYDTMEFAELLKAMAYDGQSYSFVTDASGNIIITPNHPNAMISEGNVREFLDTAKLSNGITTEIIAEHLKSKERLSFSFSSGGESRFVSVIPTGINDWNLFYVTTGSVVSQQEALSSNMTLALAVKLILIFIAIASVFVLRERNDRRILALKEEEFRIAASHSDKIIMRYDIQDKTISYAIGHAPANAVKRTLTSGVPESTVAAGLVADDSVEGYLNFYAAMRRGEQKGKQILHMKANSDEFAWFQADYTLLGDSKTPRFAIISFFDITRQREQELVFEKWQQSLQGRAPESYTLFRCTIGEETSVDTREGDLLTVSFEPGAFQFDSHTQQYVSQHVVQEDQECFASFLSTENLLANFYHGNRILTTEYREQLKDADFRWMRLTAEMVPHVESIEIEVYLMFENINEAKQSELKLLERAEKDPLTGLLNRTSFAQRVNTLIHKSSPDTHHALLMLDIDRFKSVNDVFGHAAGDQVLLDIAYGLRSVMRHDDLVARLGGDEFVVFLRDIHDKQVAINKAKQICALAKKAFSLEVQISGSVGIASTPQDGSDFDTLYRKADAALYYVKGSGKDSYAFYNSLMADEHPVSEADVINSDSEKKPEQKRRMLIVDDNDIHHVLLQNIFKDEFIIESADDGSSALVCLRHFGSAISVVLLDLMMPGMDGYAVLDEMQKNSKLRSIPVIIVSGDESREACLEAIRKGATDFITKPVDADLLRNRVHSAVSKAENDLDYVAEERERP